MMNVNKIAPCKLNFNIMTPDKFEYLRNSIIRRKKEGKKPFDPVLLTPIREEIKDLVAYPRDNSKAKLLKYMTIDGEKRIRVWVWLQQIWGVKVQDIDVPDDCIKIEEMSREEIKKVIWDKNIRGSPDFLRLAVFFYDDWVKGNGRYTQTQIAEMYGLKQQRVSELLSLLSLPPEILQDYSIYRPSGISKSQLIELARLNEDSEQIKLYEKWKGSKITKRMARGVVQTKLGKIKEEKENKKKRKTKRHTRKTRYTFPIKIKLKLSTWRMLKEYINRDYSKLDEIIDNAIRFYLKHKGEK